MLLVVAVAQIGCGQPPPCTTTQVSNGGDKSQVIASELPYITDSDPYQVGSLSVTTIEVARCDRGAPVPLRIHAPQAAAQYGVLLFQHGFMSESKAYDGMLRQVASHGFIVVAPQMYQPGLMALMGNPTAFEEADAAFELIDWLESHLSEVAGVTARMDRLAIGGHSRGGKVAWLTALKDPSRIRAIIGVDPVDGGGGPSGNQPRVTTEPFRFSVPALIIGAGLGGGCAPEGDNYVQFFEASQSPAWRVVALDYAHGDMLDESAATAAAVFCGSGENREAMRRATAGMMVLLLRDALQRAQSPATDLYEANPLPVDATVIVK